MESDDPQRKKIKLTLPEEEELVSLAIQNEGAFGASIRQFYKRNGIKSLGQIKSVNRTLEYVPFLIHLLSEIFVRLD